MYIFSNIANRSGVFRKFRDSKNCINNCFTVSFDFSSLNDKIVVSGIEEITSGNLVRTGKNTYSKVITLNEIKNGITNTIRVYIKWDNSDDESDSAIGSVINNFINVPVTIAAYQYLGEKIDIYNESTD